MSGLKEAFTFLERKMELAKEKLIRGSFSIFQNTSGQNWMNSLSFTEAEVKPLTQEDSPPEQGH